MVDAKSAIEGPTRKATGNEKRPRLISIKDVHAGVDQQIPIGTLVTTYTEDLGDTRFVITSKRVQPDGGRGSLVKYDPDLTFAELREGRFVSATTVERRAVARAERSFLGH